VIADNATGKAAPWHAERHGETNSFSLGSSGVDTADAKCGDLDSRIVIVNPDAECGHGGATRKPSVHDVIARPKSGSGKFCRVIFDKMQGGPRPIHS
jgi:hypothetical protein